MVEESKRYPWRRFGRYRDDSSTTDSTQHVDGFLPDQDRVYTTLHRYVAMDDEVLDETRCLVILGNPGYGKTDVFQHQFDGFKKRMMSTGGTIVERNLNAYDTGDSLRNGVFGGQEIEDLNNGTNEICFILDSLDECRVHLSNVASVLLETLSRLPMARIRLRIGCRSSELPRELNSGLKKMFGEDQCKLLELAPLQEKDVELALLSSNIPDPKSILESIVKRDLEPWAANPLTLRFLLEILKSKQTLPTTIHQLFDDGCLILCDESNAHRLDVGAIGTLSPVQRRAIASRIAAVTIFSNRRWIWAGQQHLTPDDAIHISEIVGASATQDDSSVDVTTSSVNETLRTGLFRLDRTDLFVWTHQTYAEHLAAGFLLARKLQLNQIQSMFSMPGDNQKKLIPQLRQTAARLSNVLPPFRRSLIVFNPDTLLASDAETISNDDRKKLVSALLSHARRSGLRNVEYDLRFQLWKLNHPTLSTQLRKVLNKDDAAASLGISIAEECVIKSLTKDLIEIACNASRPIHLRVSAVRALNACGSEESFRSLIPLAAGTAGEDPQDDLKGCALQCLWPSTIHWYELEPVLTPLKRENHWGAYSAFLRKLPETIAPSDLPAALDWIARKEAWEDTGPFHHFFYNLLQKAWENLDTAGVSTAFSSVILNRTKIGVQLRLHAENPRIPFFQDNSQQLLLSQNSEKRQKLQRELIRESSKRKIVQPGERLLPGILQACDLEYMLAQLSTAAENEGERWADWVSDLFFMEMELEFTSNKSERILDSCYKFPALAKKFKRFLGTTDLQSDDAIRRRKNYLDGINDQRKMKQMHEFQDTHIQAQLNGFLAGMSAGRLDAWWQYSQLLMGEKPFEPDLTASSMWPDDTEIQGRVLAAAKDYVQRAVPSYDTWLGRNLTHYPDESAYRALHLIEKVDSGYLSSLEESTWAKWALLVIAHSGDSLVDHIEAQKRIVKIAYQRAPKAVIAAIDRTLSPDSHVLNAHSRIELLELCRGEYMGNALARLTSLSTVPSAARIAMLRLLVTQQHPTSIEISKTWLRGVDVELAGGAAAALLLFADDCGWPIVWPRLSTDDKVLEVTLRDLHDLRREDRDLPATIPQRLTADQTADFYILLSKKYPFTDSRVDGWTHIGRKEEARDLCEELVGYLRTIGTNEAWQALERASRALPSAKWLPSLVHDARESARRVSWRPLSPQDVINFTKNPSCRLIQSERDLLEIVIESLVRYQKLIYGKETIVWNLWNEPPSRGRKSKKSRSTAALYRPKIEKRISQSLSQHFERDLKESGIVINREVEIQSALGANPGELVDIRIDVVTRQSDKDTPVKFSVIVEVKGCWNPDLRTAMEKQLKGRYLKANNCTSGVFVVGWFLCDLWDRKDSRKRQCHFRAKTEAQTYLSKQAKSLSRGANIRSFVIDAALPS